MKVRGVGEVQMMIDGLMQGEGVKGASWGHLMVQGRRAN